MGTQGHPPWVKVGTKAKWWRMVRRRGTRIRREKEEKEGTGPVGIRESFPAERRIRERAFWDGGIARDKSGGTEGRYGKECSAGESRSTWREAPDSRSERMDSYVCQEPLGFQPSGREIMRNVLFWEVESSKLAAGSSKNLEGGARLESGKQSRGKCVIWAPRQSVAEGIQAERQVQA